MKKIQLKDLEHFRSWQMEVCRTLDGNAQRFISLMPLPEHYPMILVWTTYDFYDPKSTSLSPTDKIEYNYVYIDTFPVKEIKRGTYIYQMVRTDERFQEMMECG